ncbi:hypothetical protein P692DRAFT_20828429 [Suillus brevipes Sb2]|nr:hypothetical protein P692DRAFT_20828429 [Suillus brevipes Sb2]
MYLAAASQTGHQESTQCEFLSYELRQRCTSNRLCCIAVLCTRGQLGSSQNRASKVSFSVCGVRHVALISTAPTSVFR